MRVLSESSKRKQNYAIGFSVICGLLRRRIKLNTAGILAAKTVNVRVYKYVIVKNGTITD
jgi:hypothetical protein